MGRILSKRQTGLLVSIATVISGIALGDAAYAQKVQSPLLSIFENVTLKPGFSPDPTVLRGISGGAMDAPKKISQQETPTGPCLGYIDDKPDHTLVLSAYFDYLSVQVQSSEDTTLIIQGPGGNWCNDDANGKNPGISGQWLAGTYNIWVGSYKRNQYNPYTIRISESQ
ncbi:hypothetical protein GEI7407_0841 [Geitlerinema sp. PCC 7407]|nr:hypothetical protein GEI7407_0841 [Geitlerinema sp. PCC 7407]